MRQKSAFAPNYIHSLDSSHMLMTAIRCTAAGAALPFALFLPRLCGFSQSLCAFLPLTPRRRSTPVTIGLASFWAPRADEARAV